MTPLVGNRVVIGYARHIHHGRWHMIAKIGQPHVLLAWYLANTIEILRHINTGGRQHAKDQCSRRNSGQEGHWVSWEVPEPDGSGSNVANLTPQEIACKAKRMWIYRRWNKATQRNVTFATPFPQQITFATNSNTAIMRAECYFLWLTPEVNRQKRR